MWMGRTLISTHSNESNCKQQTMWSVIVSVRRNARHCTNMSLVCTSDVICLLTAVNLGPFLEWDVFAGLRCSH